MTRIEFRRRMDTILNQHDAALAHLRTAQDQATGTSQAISDIIARHDATFAANSAAIDAALVANRAALALLREFEEGTSE